MNSLHRKIERCLRDTGLPYTIENGKKHRKIFLDGKMVGVMSNGAKGCRESRGSAGSNLISIITRIAKESRA